jgi:hypothetical protein
MTRPYFYIIKHKETGKQYAGSRWAKGCHPNELMKPDGYCTSSPIIKEIIEKESLDNFEVFCITEMQDPLAYETVFLDTNDCAGSDKWYNAHNNCGANWGTEHFKAKSKESFIKNLGVENPSQHESIKEKKKQTLLNNYGVTQTMQSPELRRRLIASNRKKYGVDYAIGSKTIRQKSIKKYLEKYGVENPFAAEEVKEKIKKYLFKTFGVTHPSQIKFMSDLRTRKTYNKASVTKLFPELKQYY